MSTSVTSRIKRSIDPPKEAANDPIKHPNIVVKITTDKEIMRETRAQR